MIHDFDENVRSSEDRPEPRKDVARPSEVPVENRLTRLSPVAAGENDKPRAVPFEILNADVRLLLPG